MSQDIRSSFVYRLIVMVMICSLTLLPLTACKNTVSVGCSYNFQTGATTCTVTGTVSNQAVGDFLNFANNVKSAPSSYTVIASAPAAYFSVDQNIPPQSTFTAVTDTGYTSSITVNLQAVPSTTPPVNAGDAVFTFAVVGSDALNTWIANVAANTTSTLNLTSTSSMPLICSSTSGVYTITAEANTESTGRLSLGSASVSIKTIGGCKPGGPECTE